MYLEKWMRLVKNKRTSTKYEINEANLMLAIPLKYHLKGNYPNFILHEKSKRRQPS
jgi:hypothetical protein